MKLLIIIAVLITYTGNSIAQKELGNDLFKYELSIFESVNDSVRNSVCLQKLNYSILKEVNKERLLFETNRIQEDLILDSTLRINYLWNASLITKLNGEFEYSNMYFDLYQKESADTSNKVKLLGLLIKSEIDSVSYFSFLHSVVKDTTYRCMNCLHELHKYVLPHKRGYVIASTLFPGLGTMMTGDFYNGFGSLLLVPGSVLATYKLWTGGLYFNAISWGYALIPRLYFGNTSLTAEKVNLIEKKKLHELATDCKEKIGGKLLQNPLKFKL